jgi:prepilin-type N-terminal cleavage/methylation domain-containing protein
MYYKNNKGFTIIEILLVVAIIGIISTIAITQVSTSRQRAKNAKIKQQVSNILSYAEKYNIENANSYTNFCTDAELNNMMNNAFSFGTTARSVSITDCISDINEYIIAVPINGTSNSVYCIDYAGNKLIVNKQLPVVFTNGNATCINYASI